MTLFSQGTKPAAPNPSLWGRELSEMRRENTYYSFWHTSERHCPLLPATCFHLGFL